MRANSRVDRDRVPTESPQGIVARAAAMPSRVAGAAGRDRAADLLLRGDPRRSPRRASYRILQPRASAATSSTCRTYFRVVIEIAARVPSTLVLCLGGAHVAPDRLDVLRGGSSASSSRPTGTCCASFGPGRVGEPGRAAYVLAALPYALGIRTRRTSWQTLLHPEDMTDPG